MVKREKVIVGNWKMHHGPSSAMALARALKMKFIGLTGVEIGVAPVFVSIPAVVEILKETNIHVGAQNAYFEEKGAFTGEVAAPMIKELGCRYVILGHSERRQYFKETDDLVQRKAKAAHNAGLVPIACVGETLAEREANQTEEVVGRQVDGSLGGLSEAQMGKTIIAYEPVWAIGTGKTATTEQAVAAHRFIRSRLAAKFGEGVADVVRIQYGGSVKPSNSAELLAEDEIDGALVGGASLVADDFDAIVKSAPRL